MRKRLPIFLGLLFILVTIQRVASFAGDTWLAWIFAAGLTISVFICAYYLRFATVRKKAAVVLLFLVTVDGLFNLSEVMLWSLATGRWNTIIAFGQGFEVHIYRVADLVYGIFPTAAAILLGWLAGGTEKIPTGKSGGRYLERLADLLFGMEDQPVTVKAGPETNGKLPGWLPYMPETRAEFAEGVSAGEIELPETITGRELAEIVPAVHNERTGRNWISAAKN